MSNFNRFGNMSPPPELMRRSYLMAEEPFHIVGNVYFVGNTWCSSHLIDTGDGLILLDTPCLPELAYLLDNIWRLGFDPRQIKYILVSHAHMDHYGAVRALVHLTGAKTLMGEVDAADMAEHPERFERMNLGGGRFNENFTPDILLKDGDVLELGNTKIRCVLTPGHTIGVMSHFWETEEDGKTYHVGIYGGAGFVTLSEDRLKECGLTVDMRKVFAQSIDKVWDEKVDVMLGNHPFHNDTYEKWERVKKGEKDAFIDPTEWHRYLQELRDRYQEFLKLSPEEIKKMYEKSYFFVYRDKAVPYLFGGIPEDMALPEA
ncbi:MBL fold metallo-hydrolase [Hominifimenecus sp. rT4P-3]|uniref:MBL fold metallo-hydrolase n=1 Tax=Hominifimenecus sp. rT4P-3 TaxID=3242979 RepID=UPI003DA4190B